LGPSNGALVLNEQISAQHEHGKSREIGWYLLCQGLTCRDPTNSREQIDSIWNAAELNHLIRLNEVRRFEIRETKFGQNGCDLLSVLRGGIEQDIEVTGVPRPAVKSQAVSTDYDVLNAAGF